MTFFNKLAETAHRNNSLVCVGLDPTQEWYPPDFGLKTNPIFQLNRRLIDATHDLVCVYKLNSAFYEAEGLAGMESLWLTVEYIQNQGIPVILDVKRADVPSTSEAYARAAFEVWRADAVTVNPYLGGDALEPFTRWEDRGVFVLCHTSNSGASDFQTMACGSEPLFVRVAQQAATWNGQANVGLVVGATYPDALRLVRNVAPDMWLLVPGVGKQGGDLEAALGAGLWPDGHGMIINSSRGICLAENPREAARDLRDRINAVRDRLEPGSSSGATATGLDVAMETIVLDLARIGAIRFGEFTLKSGEVSPVYIDLRLLASYPDVLDRVAGAYARVLQALEYDRIAAIPYAALPIGTAVSLHTGCPMIYPRKEIKQYGTARPIEGCFERGERVIVLDDLITTGTSKMETIGPLEAAGLEVQDIVVLIDRQGGGMEELTQAGYCLHSVLTLTEVLDILLAHSRIEVGQRQTVLDWLAGGSSS